MEGIFTKESLDKLEKTRGGMYFILKVSGTSEEELFFNMAMALNNLSEQYSIGTKVIETGITTTADDLSLVSKYKAVVLYKAYKQ